MPTLEVSPAAATILRSVRGARRGRLTITIDGGCCDGTAPHLYEDYVLPAGAEMIGRAEGIPVYIPGALAEQYRDAHVSLDLMDDSSSDALSLETEHGVRLVVRFG
jgi:uncharacterized protein (DUF779 family)